MVAKISEKFRHNKLKNHNLLNIHRRQGKGKKHRINDYITKIRVLPEAKL